MQGWVLSVSLKGATGQTAVLPHVLMSSVQRDSLSQRLRESLQAAALASLGEGRWASAKETVRKCEGSPRRAGKPMTLGKLHYGHPRV